MTGLIPSPPRERQGFPWLGLVVAVVAALAGIAYLIGGTHAMLLAAILFGVLVGPMLILFVVVDSLVRARRGP